MTVKILVQKSTCLSIQKVINLLWMQNVLNKYNCVNMGERIIDDNNTDGLFLNVGNALENEMERGDTIQNEIEFEPPMINWLKLFYNRAKQKMQNFTMRFVEILTEFICFSLILLHYTLGNQFFWNICNAFSSAFMEVFVYITLGVTYIIIVCLINLTEAYESYKMFKKQEHFKGGSDQLIVSHFFGEQTNIDLALQH